MVVGAGTWRDCFPHVHLAGSATVIVVGSGTWGDCFPHVHPSDYATAMVAEPVRCRNKGRRSVCDCIDPPDETEIL
ncbi:hypothetical protein AVEN_263819-1 [Araneus ventricosus]|uniref:Uncharacterized protein n=1 Tax=Araneus ventricosus TaxID=182803 RepID=A0A4Y2IHV1_ARAVE|nr:hypothetical protein AVEN_263819-1 [Araneus ventricosus]